MKKQVVFVVIADVDNQNEKGLRSSLRNWCKSAGGAHDANVRMEVVGRPSITLDEVLEIIEAKCPNPSAKTFAKVLLKNQESTVHSYIGSMLEHMQDWEGEDAEMTKTFLRNYSA